jgi:hypothetical protein
MKQCKNTLARPRRRIGPGRCPLLAMVGDLPIAGLLDNEHRLNQNHQRGTELAIRGAFFADGRRRRMLGSSHETHRPLAAPGTYHAAARRPAAADLRQPAGPPARGRAAQRQRRGIGTQFSAGWLGDHPCQPTGRQRLAFALIGQRRQGTGKEMQTRRTAVCARKGTTDGCSYGSPEHWYVTRLDVG